MDPNHSDSQARYPIRAVAQITGINPITLRAWERRYQLVTPQRSTSGHRLYSNADIARIREILRLMDSGLAISRVGDVLAHQAQTSDNKYGHEDANVWQGYRVRMVSAICLFDELELERNYNEALSLYPIDMITRRLLIPLLRELGQRWQQAKGGIAEEHFFTMYTRNKLGARFHHRSGQHNGPKLLMACLPGEHHEIGLLLFALAAHEFGFRIVLLGADMPLDELPIVAERIDADAIVLSASIEPDIALLQHDIPQLMAHTSAPVFIGGNISRSHETELRQTGAITIGTDFLESIKAIQHLLSPTKH